MQIDQHGIEGNNPFGLLWKISDSFLNWIRGDSVFYEHLSTQSLVLSVCSFKRHLFCKQSWATASSQCCHLCLLLSPRSGLGLTHVASCSQDAGPAAGALAFSTQHRLPSACNGMWRTASEQVAALPAQRGCSQPVWVWGRVGKKATEVEYPPSWVENALQMRRAAGSLWWVFPFPLHPSRLWQKC